MENYFARYSDAVMYLRKDSLREMTLGISVDRKQEVSSNGLPEIESVKVYAAVLNENKPFVKKDARNAAIGLSRSQNGIDIPVDLLMKFKGTSDFLKHLAWNFMEKINKIHKKRATVDWFWYSGFIGAHTLHCIFRSTIADIISQYEKTKEKKDE